MTATTPFNRQGYVKKRAGKKNAGDAALSAAKKQVKTEETQKKRAKKNTQEIGDEGEDSETKNEGTSEATTRRRRSPRKHNMGLR
ncbi:uncharacterized protein SCHCODRAFT_02316257 [Schizophyllum commune H4-8]|uniref:uncharacterized protein n=1 Tax=Schizophyllum commune (strain H4-8 / FGSC 9210) TaxID=578458 RepID=UPI00216083E3|nr:uncharacterized protein SCHCODRAFT_02316257 [Schizophyllum commune H4-8]KAI5891323.1 hypothetical protein SCHCODRAFT_02316257 [Schizophyllum commune H4-8]